MFPPLSTSSKLAVAKEAVVRFQPEMNCVDVPLELGTDNQATADLTGGVGGRVICTGIIIRVTIGTLRCE